MGVASKDVLGRRDDDIDKDFNVGLEGEGAFDAIGRSIVHSGLVKDDTESVVPSVFVKDDAEHRSQWWQACVRGTTIMIIPCKGGVIMACDGFAFLKKQICQRCNVVPAEVDINIDQCINEIDFFIDKYWPDEYETADMVDSLYRRMEFFVTDMADVKIFHLGDDGDVSVACSGNSGLACDVVDHLNKEIECDTAERVFTIEVVVALAISYLEDPGIVTELPLGLIFVSYKTLEGSRMVPRAVYVWRNNQGIVTQEDLSLHRCFVDGEGIPFARKVIKKLWYPDCEIKEGISLTKEAMRGAFLGRMSGGVTRIVVVKENGVSLEYNDTLDLGPAGPVLSRLTRDIYSFVQEGRLAALTLYIERNDISVNFKDRNGKSLLHLAVIGGHFDIVQMLINKKADLNDQLISTSYLCYDSAEDNFGKTPLHYAALNNQKAIAELLVQHKANVDVMDSDGSYAFHLCLSDWPCLQLNELMD